MSFTDPTGADGDCDPLFDPFCDPCFLNPSVSLAAVAEAAAAQFSPTPTQKNPEHSPGRCFRLGFFLL
jgi:hypothetical protein